MSNTTLLLGAEDVLRGGHAVERGGTEIRHAASAMEDSCARQRQFLDDWLQRFAEVLEQDRAARELPHVR